MLWLQVNISIEVMISQTLSAEAETNQHALAAHLFQKGE